MTKKAGCSEGAYFRPSVPAGMFTWVSHALNKQTKKKTLSPRSGSHQVPSEGQVLLFMQISGPVFG